MNKQQLASKIWASANKMRSKIEANEYKDYILGFIFYKFLSDQEESLLLSDGWTKEDIKENLPVTDAEDKLYIQRKIGYYIPYTYLFSTWLNSDFDASQVTDALNSFENNIYTTHSKVFSGIFATLNTGLSKLGDTNAARTKSILELLKLIKDIPTDDTQDYDVLGFIYEYLISNFAASAGKKAGEFYTPHEVALLMAEIVSHHLRRNSTIEIYDPTSGSGSLLINIGRAASKHLRNRDSIKYYAQELKTNTYNLTRMNLIMRGIKPENIQVRCGDTLDKDWPWFDDNDPIRTYNPLYLDAVISNPPYSQQWDNKNKQSDPRYADFGVAPKGKADYAFLLHDLFHVKPGGIMTIVLPHGVLFRGKEEGAIRMNLIEKNHIDAIIGLPANIFFGTGIPTIIMVLRQKRPNTDVLFIDASHLSVKSGKQNKLTASDIRRIADTWIERDPKDASFARLVTREEIRNNGYNLNIPRYVNSSGKPETWDLYATMFGGVPKSEIATLDKYWNALPGLKESLFEDTATPYTSFKTDTPAETVANHMSVQDFTRQFAQAFSPFGAYLKTRLIDGMNSLNIASEEDTITRHIFELLAPVPLIDRYEAYQLFADKWTEISQDLEIIQTEGFMSTRQVDPNMVIKKKGDEEKEEQNGYKGHVLPFELVQKIFLSDKLKALSDKQAVQSASESLIDQTFAEIPDEDKEKISDDEGNLSAKEAKALYARMKRSRDEDEEQFFASLKTICDASEQVRKLKSEIKRDALDLHFATKNYIETSLSDDDVLRLLEIKWIDGLCEHLAQLPTAVISTLNACLLALQKKYAVTLVDVENDIRAASEELSGMIDQLTGGDYDMKALAEFQKTLKTLKDC